MGFLGVISLFFSLLSVFIGYNFPKRSAWFILLTTPILAPGKLVLVPSPQFPLQYIIFSFFLALGISMSPKFKRLFRLKWFLKYTWVKIAIVFIIYLLVVSFPDRIFVVIFLDFANIFIALIVSFILVTNKSNLLRVVKILVWQGAVVGAFALIDYAGIFNISEFLRQTMPNYDISRLAPSFRAGFTRVTGLDGSASQTASRLSFLFFLALWYSFGSKKIFVMIPLMFILLGLVLLMTRSAFVSVILSFIILLVFWGIHKERLSKIIKLTVILLFTFFMLILIFPYFYHFFVTFVENYFIPSFQGNKSVQVKVDRLPMAINFFMNSPLTGYGSRAYVYYDLMNTLDLPAPFIYLLSGGIGLMILFFLLYLHPLYWIHKHVNKVSDNEIKILLIFSFAALLAGFLNMLSNYLETHRLIMYVLFASILKYDTLCNSWRASSQRLKKQT